MGLERFTTMARDWLGLLREACTTEGEVKTTHSATTKGGNNIRWIDTPIRILNALKLEIDLHSDCVGRAHLQLWAGLSVNPRLPPEERMIVL